MKRAVPSLVLLFALGACVEPPRELSVREAPPQAAAPLPAHAQGPMASFPCTTCHEEEPFVAPPPPPPALARARLVLEREGVERGCVECHEADLRASKDEDEPKAASPEESRRLCARCHGDKFQEWRLGRHGRSTSDLQTRGPVCVRCHDPHGMSGA